LCRRDGFVVTKPKKDADGSEAGQKNKDENADRES